MLGRSKEERSEKGGRNFMYLSLSDMSRPVPTTCERSRNVSENVIFKAAMERHTRCAFTALGCLHQVIPSVERGLTKLVA